MKATVVQHNIEVKVYYEDTDSLGVVYYANYFRYYERGRSEYFEALGRGVREWNEAGYNVAVFKVAATFHQPARLGERLRVQSELVPLSPFRLQMDQKIFRGDTLINEAKVQLVCLDQAMEVREFPEEMIAVAD